VAGTSHPTSRGAWSSRVDLVRRSASAHPQLTWATGGLADLILVVEAGRVVERGTHERLMALGGRYAELYGLQARGYR
jgi:hypothetical protein